MMHRKSMSAIGLMAILTLVLAATSYGQVVGDFEGQLDNWRAGDGMTAAFGAFGATVGTQAMEISGPGGWHMAALVDAKSVRAALGKKGVKITADVTAFPADMTTTWMQVGIVINGQNNDDNGAGNNLGWNDLGSQDVARDGQPHTMTWTLSDTLAAKIAGTDDTIGWFEIVLISNLDGASVTKFYVDNVQVVSEAPSAVTVISSFENGLDGWYTDTWTAGTTATGDTGATAGAKAMQVSGPGGWQQLTKVSVKPYLTTLATPGVKVMADITAFEADMTTTWMQIGMILNCQNNADNGANNNLGWIDLGSQDIVRDGQPHTITWAIPDATTAKIAAADENIGWFEFLLISNTDGASVAKFYVDNVRIVVPVTATGKSSDFIIGNWEQDMDGWVKGGDADVLFNDHNGVTLDNYSLDVWVPTGAWASVLTLNLFDPNNADALAAFRANTKFTVDITHLVADWPVDDIPPWNGTHLIINTSAEAVPSRSGGYIDLGYKAGWSQNNGDRTDTTTWDYSQVINELNANWSKVTYLEINIVVNANSADYAGTVWFYLDNARLSGGGIAMNPKPADGAKDVNAETKLSWTAGAKAASHNLYLGASRAAVLAANGASDPTVTFAQIDGTSFDPNGLEFNTQYFWRVDAVNDVSPDSPWTGPIWTFTTGNFLVVDDFEGYTNDSPNRVFQTWVDGYGFSADEFYPKANAGNGSDAAVGHDIWSSNFYQTIVETKTIHGGAQAMPLYYDNATAGYSEATRTWAQPQDWTVNGFNALTLFVCGNPSNVADTLYVTLTDSAGKSVTMTYADAAIFTAETWTEWTIPAAKLAGVDLTSITGMVIGVGSKTKVSKASGLLLIDDIRVGAQPTGLVAYYKCDGNLNDSSGNGHNGTFAGDPNLPAKYIAGPTGFGQALLFDGTGGHQNVECGTFNPSVATGKLTVALWAKWDGASDQWQGLIGKRDSWAVDDMMWHIEVNHDAGTIGFARYDVYPDSGGAKLTVGAWTHVAVTFDGTTATFYINGVRTGSGGFSFGTDKGSALHFGSDDPNGGNAFNGALDEVRIYDTVLSEAEIKALMTK